MKLVQPIALHKAFDVAGAMQATYFDAGHIIGSAFAALEFEGKRVVFSGDLGRYDRPLLFDPEAMGAATDLICESTYANQVHPPQPLEDLRQAILAGIARGGAIVIPAFAVERSQDILLAIATLQAQDSQIAKLPVHLDSPMAEKVDAVFEHFPDAHKPIPNDSPSTPFGVRDFTQHVTTQESKALNDVDGSHLILSASGMASGGRVLHHLHNNIGDPKATIIFPGYQSLGTLGYILTHGAKHSHGSTTTRFRFAQRSYISRASAPTPTATNCTAGCRPARPRRICTPCTVKHPQLRRWPQWPVAHLDGRPMLGIEERR